MKSNPPENGPKVTGDEQCMRLSSDCPKKTRDLPNVSECRACGSRVDSCEGKGRIRLLYSEWRVILLCRKCLVRVESAKICSYCFRDASIEDCVRCCQCRRSLHSSCFQHYRTVPVCSCNSLPGKDFFICVDCWVPISIARKRRISKSKGVCQHGMSLKPLDVNRGVSTHGKNVEPVGLRKTIVEKNAVELDRNALDLEKGGACSCEGQRRNLHPEVEMNPLNPNLSANSPEEKLIDQSETSTARCLNVYARSRWRSGKYLWITKGCFGKVDATKLGSRSTRLMNVYVRKRGKNGKFGEKEVEQEKGNSYSSLAEPVVLIDERQRFSVKPMKVYARVRLKNNGCTRKHSGDQSGHSNATMQPDVG